MNELVPALSKWSECDTFEKDWKRFVGMRVFIREGKGWKGVTD